MSTEIQEISLQEVWSMRHRIMYPDQSFDYIKLPLDNVGKHYGLFNNKVLVSVVSLYFENNKAQFRKLATEVEEQGKGYGTELLNYIFELAKSFGVESVWCNARAKKTDFYKKFGMVETDKTYTKVGIDFVVMEKNI